MCYNEVVAYLYDIPKFTKKHTFEHTREFIRRLGNPCHMKKVIHVAGTNGKGSVCAYMQAILLSESKTVGFFTSPHLEKVNERIRINGVNISDEMLVQIFEKVKKVVDEMMAEGMEHPSYFEFIYGMGMLAFEMADVEYIILETGLGGRLDATNSFEHPCLTVITSIGLDHTEILGDTIEKIAWEKAGIIKEGVPVVYDGSQEASSVVIYRRAMEMNAPCREIGKDAFEIKEITDKHIAFSILDDYDNNTLWQVKSTGMYQVMNMTLAVQGMKYIFGETADLKKWADVLKSVCWSGRMEEVLPGVILDGAHNPPAITRFVESLQFQKEYLQKTGKSTKTIILFSAVTDKDYEYMIESLCKEANADAYIITKLDSDRAAAIKDLASMFEKHTDHPVYMVDSIKDAFAKALEEKGEDGTLYCLGSLYLIGELKTIVGGSYA